MKPLMKKDLRDRNQVQSVGFNQVCRRGITMKAFVGVAYKENYLRIVFNKIFYILFFYVFTCIVIF